MENILKVAILVKLMLGADISVYPEHNPLATSDYLHIHFSDLGTQAKKLIYKMPMKFGHDEIFVIKICPTGTVAKLETSNNKERLLKTCFSDSYSSLIGFNHYIEAPLYQFGIHNHYKTCFFGGAPSEAERSLYFMPAEDIIKNKTLNDPTYFYTESEEIVKKYQDSKTFNYRQKMSVQANQDFRCTLQYNIVKGFNINNFEDKTSFQRNDGKPSVLIIEYKADELKEDSKYEVVFSEFPKNDLHTLDSRRQQVVKKLQSSVSFIRSVFENSVIKYKLSSGKKTKLGIVLDMKASKPGVEGDDQMSFPIVIKNNEYVRFVPLVCKGVLTEAETTSYMFLNSKDCLMVGKKKVLIASTKGRLKFLTSETVKNPHETIDLSVLTMNFQFFAKNKPEEVFSIQGFLPRSDVMYDADRAVVYHISYQKSASKINNVEQGPPIDPVGRVIPIMTNGKDKIGKRLLGDLDNYQKFFLVVIGIFSCIALGALFIWASSVLAFVAIVIIIICAIFIGVRNNSYRILEEGKMDVDFQPKSFVEYMKKESIEKHKIRIKNLSEATPKCFQGLAEYGATPNQGSKWVNKVVVDIEAYNKKLNQIDEDSKKSSKSASGSTVASSGLDDFSPEMQNLVATKEKENLQQGMNNI